MEIIRPQEGYQMKALSSSADILVGGAAAGVGKTFTLLLDPLKHILTVPRFGGVIFRRTSPQIKGEGGLWDASNKLYSKINDAYSRESTLEWLFKVGTQQNKLKFSHLEYEKNVFDWQGSEIPFIGFDELTHFSEQMFFYLLTRNRSTCGVRPYVRATCNPDPDSWLAEFISWWIDDEGFPDASKNGVIRYFMRNGNDTIWGDSIDDVYSQNKYLIDEQIKASGGLVGLSNLIKSFTFVSGSIYDNKKLLEINPDYLGNLMSLNEEDKSRLLLGNWKKSNDERNLIDHSSFLGMFYNLYKDNDKKRKIVADVALEGSNKMPIMCFEGKCLIDIVIIPRSNGKEVIDHIKAMAQKHQVPNKDIYFDSDGIGGFVKGFIIGSNPFRGNDSVKEVRNKVTGKKEKPNYFNFKTQCYYELANDINNGEWSVSEHVANMSYDGKITIKQRLEKELKCLKKAPDSEGKKKIITKEEMKAYLPSGDSPDLFDCFMIMKGSYLVNKFVIYG